MEIRQNIIVTVILALFLAACSQKPVEIHYQSDECAHCKMMIMDPRFATQAVTSTGKAIKFDAIECMADYLQEENIETESAKFWVNNFDNPGNWIEAEQAIFIKSDEIQSPMGGSLLALHSRKEAEDHLQEYSGEQLDWESLLTR